MVYIPNDYGGGGGSFDPAAEAETQRRVDAAMARDEAAVKAERDRIEIARGTAEANAWYQKAQIALEKKKLALSAVETAAKMGGPGNWTQYLDYINGAPYALLGREPWRLAR